MIDDFRTLLSRDAAKRSSLERCIDSVPLGRAASLTELSDEINRMPFTMRAALLNRLVDRFIDLAAH